jgi:predicted ArsR family transcriptional regulator
MPFQIQRFAKSLSTHVGQGVDEQLLQNHPKYDTLTTPSQTSKWIAVLMNDLDAQLGEDLVRQVMEDCGKECIGQSILTRAKQLKQQATDLDDLLERLNQVHIGGGLLHREGDKIFAAYTSCYCGSVSKTRQPISTSYCQCSCGWYKQLFESILEKPVRVELVDSIIHGADACKFVIYI